MTAATAVPDIVPPKAFPFVRSEGAPRDVGRNHGRTFGDRVLGSIGVYRGKFDRMGLEWPRVLRLAERSGALLRSFDPALAEELDGIAEGAEVDPREILVINIRTGLTRMVEVAAAEDHECTTTAVLGSVTADGHTLMGQNWDQSGVCQPNTVVIEQHIAGQPALLFVTEAGILFRHGMNDAGVGCVGNALRTDRETSADQGMPAPVARRRALRETNLAAARHALVETPRSHSANHMLADAGGAAVDLESVPGHAYEVHPDDGILVHSNHFLSPDAQGALDDRGRRTHPDTLYRDCRVRDALSARRGSIGVEDIKSALRDHHGYPLSVCRHPRPDAEEIGYTLVSSVIDLTERRMWTAPGPACVGTYTEYRFS
jgi:isopenicillin-N N-acyltransferase-like protein